MVFRPLYALLIDDFVEGGFLVGEEANNSVEVRDEVGYSYSAYCR